MIKKGDVVKVSYEGRFDDGEVFDSSKHGDHEHPLEFEVGSGQVIEGFDNTVLGMEKNQEAEFTIESDKAYGPHRAEMVMEFEKSKLGIEQEVEPGMIMVLQTQTGEQVPAKVVKGEGEKITLDLNHPLAGKRLTFKIKILGINEPTSEEHHHH